VRFTGENVRRHFTGIRAHGVCPEGHSVGGGFRAMREKLRGECGAEVQAPVSA